MEEQRSDMDKVLQTAVTVYLGGKPYAVKPLAVKYAVPWDKKVIKIYLDIISKVKPEILRKDVKDLDITELEPLLLSSMSTNPEQLIELFWEYAKDLNRAEIEEVATVAEVLAGFREVIKFEAPFFAGISNLNVLSQNLPSSK